MTTPVSSDYFILASRRKETRGKRRIDVWKQYEAGVSGTKKKTLFSFPFCFFLLSLLHLQKKL